MALPGHSEGSVSAMYVLFRIYNCSSGNYKVFYLRRLNGIILFFSKALGTVQVDWHTSRKYLY